MTFRNKVLTFLFSIFIISLFFPLRKVFFINSAYLTGAYSDFTSFSLYLSDILLFTTWWTILMSRGGAREWVYHVVKNLKFLIFWLILGFLWHLKSSIPLNWYFLFKYAELIVAYGTTAYLFSNLPIKRLFLNTFAILGSIQSILALLQFGLQKSLNLKFLGENLLNINILGVAKIVSGGTTYIRGYGTFPHPNLLSAFLLVSIFAICYLYLTNTNRLIKVLYATLLILNILGLTITFSRASYLALLTGLVIFFIHSLFGLNNIKEIYRKSLGCFKNPLLWIFIGSIIGAFVILKPFLITRATISDQATLERKEYNQIGLRIIKNNLIFGTGIGESVLHMEQYAGYKLETWQKQPIHNYFLLSAAELGVMGSIILLWIFISHLVSIWHVKTTFFQLLLVVILIAFLTLMLFDHYFYTLEQTQLLLWIILGLVASEIKTPFRNESKGD